MTARPRRRPRSGAVVAWATLGLGAAGCGRGCDGAGPAATVAPTVATAASIAPQGATTAVPAGVEAVQPPTGADAVAGAVGVALPERLTSDVLPGLATLPRRRLPSFDPRQHCVVRLDAEAATLLEARVANSAWSRDDAPLTALLRAGAEEWSRRSGVAAQRVVLAIDAAADRRAAAALRRVAHAARTWRVVMLTREGPDVWEVMLDPPPALRARPAPGP